MRTEMDDEYREAIRRFMERKGIPVEINPDARYDFDEVSAYGWHHYAARDHCRSVQFGGDGCSWIVRAGATLVERTYSQFQDTFSENLDEVGINVSPCECRCGKYTNMTLRFAGSLGEVLQDLFGPQATNKIIL